MSTPLISQRPRSGLSNPMIDLRKTDLPVPDGPSMTLTSPGGSVNVTSRQMVWRPKDFVRPSTTTSAPIEPPAPSRGIPRQNAVITCNEHASWWLLVSQNHHAGGRYPVTHSG